MASEVAHRLVELGLVAAGLRDKRARVVGHDELRTPAVEAQRARQRAQPRAHALIDRGTREDVARCAHGRDEDLRACPVGQRQG